VSQAVAHTAEDRKDRNRRLALVLLAIAGSLAAATVLVGIRW
jgi:hypothetical protein